MPAQIIPLKLAPQESFAFYRADTSSRKLIPLYAGGIPAGFPSPADDYLEGLLDLNEHLISNQAATFFVRCDGDSMIEAGIHPGDILVINRSLEAKDKDIVVATISGEFTLKRLRYINGKPWLYPENKNYMPIPILSDEFQVWGVVEHSIRNHKR